MALQSCALDGALWNPFYGGGYPFSAAHGVFIYGVTEPSTENAGVLLGVDRDLYAGPSQIVGWATQAEAFANMVMNKNVTSLITVKSGYVYFYNCFFSGGPGTFDTGQVDCRAGAVARVTFLRCTFNPTAPSYFLDAVIGHHMTLDRCHISHAVDGVGSYNQYGTRTDNIVMGCYFEHSVRYEVDLSHTDGTHNDAVQHQGGLGLTVLGNSFHGYAFHEDGSVPDDPWWRTAQCVLTQENVAINGVYYCGDINVQNNWIYGFMHPLVFKTRSSGGETAYDTIAKNNRWMNNDQRIYGITTPRPYNIRLDMATTINGISYPLSDVAPGGTLDTNGNGYADVADVDPVLRGQPVYVRRDNFLGG